MDEVEVLEQNPICWYGDAHHGAEAGDGSYWGKTGGET